MLLILLDFLMVSVYNCSLLYNFRVDCRLSLSCVDECFPSILLIVVFVNATLDNRFVLKK